MTGGCSDSLKVLVLCGSRARRMRLMALWRSPERLAIERVLQRVASMRVVYSVSLITRSTSAFGIFRGAPGPGYSRDPPGVCREIGGASCRRFGQCVPLGHLRWSRSRLGHGRAIAKHVASRPLRSFAGLPTVAMHLVRAGRVQELARIVLAARAPPLTGAD